MQIQLLTVPGCSRCEKVKRMLAGLGIKYEIIDATENPEYVDRYRIFVAPGITVDGRLVFVGVPRKMDLLDLLGFSQV